MDLTFPAVVDRAARAARDFVESRFLPVAESGRDGANRRRLSSALASLVTESSLAHFAVFRELGGVAAPWAETFRAADLQFHALADAGVRAEAAGLVGLALGDPRRQPDPEALGVRAGQRGETWELDGMAITPGYLAPVDSLLTAAVISGGEVGLFLITESPRASTAGGADLVCVDLEGTPAELRERGPGAWPLLLALRRRERLSQIALAVGAAHRAHAGSLDATRAATVVKDPLALGQGIQFQVADNAIDLQVAETLALHGATLADAGTLTDAELASTRFMVLDALERIALRAAHITGVFAATAPPWTAFFVDLARRLKLEGGAVELDRREAALGLLQTA